MSKKRKKIVRPHYTPKAVRAQNAPKKPVPRELKFGIAFCVFALVLAVVLFFALYDDGSLDVQADGRPVVGEGNWLVVNKGDNTRRSYFQIGEVNAIGGYTQREEDPYQNNQLVYFFEPEDESGQILNYYVSAINRTPAVNAEAANNNYRVYIGDLEISDVQTMEIDGIEVSYFTTVMPESENADSQQQLLAYLPGPRDSSVLVVITARVTQEEPPLEDTVLLEMLDQIRQGITLQDEST